MSTFCFCFVGDLKIVMNTIKALGIHYVSDVVVSFMIVATKGSCFILVIDDLQLVLSTGSGVNGFTLDPSLGEFILTHPDIKVKKVR